MSTVAAVVAAYAAVVATASLAWQFYAWRHRQQNRVAVSVRLAIASPAPGVTVHALSITATNNSEHAVRVTGVGLDLNRRDGWQFHQAAPIYGATLPGVVQPHDAGVAMIDREGAEGEGLNLTEPVVAWVRLATGEIVNSEPTQIIRSQGGT
ncbi:MAG TPA: hypothetical protein VGH14_08460 [Solirubrobacterales bacterium]|jgi:hypothetical protein